MSMYRDLMALDDGRLRSMYQTLHGTPAPGYLHRLKIVSAIMQHPEAQSVLPRPVTASGNGEKMGMNGEPHPPAAANGHEHQNANGTGEQLAALIRSLAASSMDEKRVSGMIADALAAYTPPAGPCQRVEVTVQDRPPVDVGVQHAAFPTLVKACSARTADGHRLNIWLAGPAGTGKTTGAKMAAKALGLPFVANGAIQTPYELTGFVTATGTLVRTPFREAWENGGVYLFDEVDASHPAAVCAFNAALANGTMSFPDGMIPRHADCVIVAAANTFGGGSTHEYNGRAKQDAAFLDRFIMIRWDVDADLERAMVPNADWTARVQGVRQRAAERGIKGYMVTPRASVYGAALLAAGLDRDTVEILTLRKGLDADTWNAVRGGN